MTIADAPFKFSHLNVGTFREREGAQGTTESNGPYPMTDYSRISWEHL